MLAASAVSGVGEPFRAFCDATPVPFGGEKRPARAFAALQAEVCGVRARLISIRIIK